jgi:hypothetical protein
MIKPDSAERYPVQILSHPTIRHEGNVTILSQSHWLTYNDSTSEHKTFDTCRITSGEQAAAADSWRAKLRATWARLRHWANSEVWQKRGEPDSTNTQD